MPEISNLTRQKVREATIDMGDGDTVTVTFDSNKLSPAWIADAQRRDEEKDQYSLAKSLADVIIDWDVTQDGQPYPPSPENIGVLSYPAQTSLLQQILGATVPGAAEGNASSKPSSTPPMVSAAPPQTSQNGPQTSPSLTPSASPSPT